MENKLEKYQEMFNKYNEFEKQNRPELTAEESIYRFFELVEFGYKIIPPEEIEKAHREKYERYRELVIKYSNL